MPVPKRRTSLSKARSRRASNMKHTVKNFTHCQHCKEAKMMHHLCSNCGKYAGKQIENIPE